MPLPFDKLPIPGKSVAPDGVTRMTYFVSHETIRTLEENGPEWKYTAGQFIPQALENATRIFEGLKRPDMLDGFCYITKPEPEALEGGYKISPPSGMVLLVYVQGEFVFDWDWRPEDPDLPGQPMSCDGMFWRETWRRP